MLHALVSAIAANNSRTIQEKQLTIQINIADSLSVSSDKVLLSMLLHNVIGNAVKFSHACGIVRIDCIELSDTFKITVSDNGPGINEADMPHIFERFYRPGTSHNTPGSGLGLAIVKKITGLLGCTVAVTSSPGRGTVFQFVFPKV